MLKRPLFLTLLPLFAQAEELPSPIKAVEKQGITIIKSFDAPGGVKGWLGKYQDMGVTIYLTPDGKHAISGYMYDENGINLSEKVIQKEIYAPAGRELWQRMEKANWLLEGDKNAPRVVYLFADPFCPYCKQFWQQAQPWVKAGKVQLRTLLVGVIKPESTATAAAILASQDPARSWHNYETAGSNSAPTLSASPDSKHLKMLKDHEAIMDALGANATPAIYYMNDENELQQVTGLPDNEQMKQIMNQP